MRDVCASFSSTPHFKKLTEQEKREIGVYIISLYEPFAVLRERLATAVNNSTFFGPFFLARKKARKKYERSELERV